MQFKKTQLVQILGCSQATEDKWIDAINNACAKFNINTKLRLAAFIAQVGHESGRLSAVTENLNYSAEGLQKTWPSRFNSSNAQAYARKPMLIASKVYASRMGNGDEISQDGWKYRGRGLIQCTGKTNYDAFSQACGVDAVNNPDSLAEPTNAALSAAWFWGSKGLNAYADRGEFLTITKRINGGTIGQEDRELLYKKALIVLSDEEPPKSDEELKNAPVPPNPYATEPVTEQKTPAAQNSAIVEPRAASSFGSGKYPWNLVYESRSGHVIEYDDTPGAERLNMTHRTGSYWEINPDGTFTNKSVLDSYRLTKEDHYAYTGGNLTTQVKGQSFHQVGGDFAIKTGGNYFINAPRIQFNTGTFAVSGEILAPRITADIFESPFANTLAKVAMVAWDLGGGAGGNGVGGRAAMGTPVINASLGFAGTDATESLRSNKLASQKPDGTPIITNGVADAAKIAAVAGVAASAVADILKNNDTDEKVANAMTSAAEELDGAGSDNPESRTPVFLKHVSFDKPTLISQSTILDKPDPSLYVNNLHTIVDASGVGKLHMSDGQNWNPVGDPAAAKAYTDEQVGVVRGDLQQEIQDRILAVANETQARTDAIAAETSARTQAIADEATARQAAVTAEADARQTADTSLSDRIVTLTASVNNNAAAIQTEQTARADADTALANDITALVTKTDNTNAALTSEQTTRANADSALASDISALVTKTDNTNASLVSEQTARANADSAMASDITALQTKTDNTNASLVSEQTARADADSALASDITALQTKTDNTNAALASEQQARADADSAMASDISTVSAAASAAQSTADTANNTANSAISQLNDIADDNILTKGEKPPVIKEYAQLTGEQTNLESQGTLFGITTEKTNYTTAINALKTYITGLAPAYDDLTQNTTIVGTTFRTKFQDVYAARTSLMNAIDSKAKTLADNAQTTANNAATAASNAQTAADNAQTSANQANTAIANITNDNVLSKGEKSAVILEYGVLSGEQTGIDTQATTYGITTEKTAYDNAVSALSTYLNGLAPAWNDTTQDTTIVGTTFRSKFQDVYGTRQTLLNKIYEKAKSLADNAQTTANNAQTAASNAQTAANNAQTAADNAQTSANTANAAISNITSDNVLSKGEKSSAIQEYGVLTGEQSGIDSQATTYGISTEKTAYDNAIAALTTYLNGLTPAWNDTAQDTTIVGTTYRQKFSDVYSTRQTLLNAIYAKAKTLADNAQSTANTAVTNAANAQTSADNAQTTATNAQTAADNANTAIANISSDNVLSKGEKGAAIQEYGVLTGEQSGIDSQADTYGVSRTAYDNAITALTSYLNGLTPAWNDTAQDTTIVGTTYRQKFSDVYSARQTLLNTIYAKAKQLADAAQSTANDAATAASNAQTAANNAQTSANTANNAIANITSDDVLSKGEKGSAIQEYNNLINEQSGIDSQADAFSVSRTSYDNAVTALTTYLNGLTPAWNDVSQDTTIVGTTYRTKFNDVYTTRQALLNSIYAKAKQIADSKAKVTRSATAPTSPAVGDIWVDISVGSTSPISKIWNGSSWEATDYRVAANEAAITTEQQARADGDSANATQITTLKSRVNNGDSAPFEGYLTWDFNGSSDSWTASGATLSNAASYLTVTSTGTDPFIDSPTISVNGALYDKVRARIKRTAGTGWQGSLFYTTAGHGSDAGYVKTIPAPESLSDWVVVEWDMSNLTAGGTNWVSNTITAIRLDLGNTASDEFQIDWIAVGKRGAGVQTSQFATVQQTVSTHADDIGNIKAQWGIKTDVNGKVAGIALVNDLINGAPVSKFSVNADQFEIVNDTSGARLVMTNQLISIYDSNNVLRVKLGIW